MTYQETEDFLFNQLPIYQNQGRSALNRNLEKTILLLKHLGNPHNNFKSFLIAGTNGKGSSCHMIASILQEAGYKTGLHTSPHLKSYTERVRINGVEIEKDYVTSFIGDNIDYFKELLPSFFEITVALAFKYFSDKKVDIAIVEVGMGGRFDSTNVLNPMVCLITNIGLDHQHILGNTIAEIAAEKAGIIKHKTKVIIGEINLESAPVFKLKAKELHSEIVFSDMVFPSNLNYELDLKGEYQSKNLPGVLCLIDELKRFDFIVNESHIVRGLSSVVVNNSLKGRWQKMSSKPLTICDTAHNIDGVNLVVKQIEKTIKNKLFVVFGMVNDKTTIEILTILPKDAYYFFVQPLVPRAKLIDELFEESLKVGLAGEVVRGGVNEAIKLAQKKASKEDMIYIGGSTFVVAEIENL